MKTSPVGAEATMAQVSISIDSRLKEESEKLFRELGVTFSEAVRSQIASKDVGDEHAIKMAVADFDAGVLSVASNVRPNKLFTAETNIIAYKAGALNREKTNSVVAESIRLLEHGG